MRGVCVRSEEEVRERIRRLEGEMRGLAKGLRGAMDVAVFAVGGVYLDAKVSELEWVLGKDSAP